MGWFKVDCGTPLAGTEVRVKTLSNQYLALCGIRVLGVKPTQGTDYFIKLRNAK